MHCRPACRARPRCAACAGDAQHVYRGFRNRDKVRCAFPPAALPGEGQGEGSAARITTTARPHPNLPPSATGEGVPQGVVRLGTRMYVPSPGFAGGGSGWGQRRSYHDNYPPPSQPSPSATGEGVPYGGVRLIWYGANDFALSRRTSSRTIPCPPRAPTSASIQPWRLSWLCAPSDTRFPGHRSVLRAQPRVDSRYRPQ